MTIGRTDDPENPFGAKAFKAAFMFGLGSRTPSGPAAVLPRQQAGHMIAIDPPVRILIFSLASEGPSTHAPRRLTDFKVLTFDCYGTLIDWESGMVEALKPIIGKIGRTLN